ncbi:hypothetical protein GCM10012287_14490 [Streptomyces daqingensis]|uniref:Uncharacterized protein n=1 Tax=Streptomyces daqingensis TaxID=1472640 RepID=A0ABQ2M166_9ACTN|nr:hypothetical protein GCM10012287_14490 [Streptomyces daqingensis]
MQRLDVVPWSMAATNLSDMNAFPFSGSTAEECPEDRQAPGESESGLRGAAVVVPESPFACRATEAGRDRRGARIGVLSSRLLVVSAGRRPESGPPGSRSWPGPRERFPKLVTGRGRRVRPAS